MILKAKFGYDLLKINIFFSYRLDAETMIIKKQECQQEQPKRYAVEVLVKKIPNSQEVFFFKLLFLSLSSLPAHNVLFLIYFDVFLLETFLICILFRGFIFELA